MFQSARLKLTAWYLIIIMIISTLFSAVIYVNTSRQIEGLARMQNDRTREFRLRTVPEETTEGPPLITNEEIEAERKDLLYTLLIINASIFLLAGISGYFLAGKTLGPIGLMIEEQNQFITDASHELRTPIATLRAEMEAALLEKKLTSQEARKLIRSNLEDVDRLQSLSANLLKLTRIHYFDGQSEEKQVPTSLLTVIKGAVIKIEPLAKNKKIKLVLKVKEAVVLANKESLEQLFIILLDNAIKYSPQNSKITIISQKTDGKIKILVVDHGEGISQADLPHIFERFFRADKSRSVADGYGLGLSIAKKIVDSHKGKISVVSKIDKGSTFTVTLPLIHQHK